MCQALYVEVIHNQLLHFFVATRTEVISLQDLCIEYIATLIESPGDVQCLPMPSTIKDKIAKFVLNPNEDFSFVCK